MKKLLYFLLFIPFLSISQRYDADITQSTKYFITRDTSTDGIITIRYKPSESVELNFDRQLKAISADSTSLKNLKDEITVKLKDLLFQRQQILARKTKLGF